MTTLRVDLFQKLRLEFEPYGLFVRPYVRTREDRHLSLFAAPVPGSDALTPHLTRRVDGRRKERVPLPRVRPDDLETFAQKFLVGALRCWNAALVRQDLERLRDEGWRIHQLDDAEFRRRVVRETSTLVTIALGESTLAKDVFESLDDGASPLDLEDGPTGRHLIAMGVRSDPSGEILDVRALTWLANGAWEPVGGAWSQVHPRGWYELPRNPELNRQVFVALGPSRERAFHAVAQQVGDFLFP